jgi:tetratricopeptide (TPR) repeat protein
MGDHAAAVPLKRLALEIRRAALGEHHPDYANSLNSLASLYLAMGDHAAALPLFHQALEIRRTALGEHHPDYATSLHNLAALYLAMGDHAAALPLYRQAVEITRTALGENHPDLATSLNNLAALYRAMGDHAAALPLCRQALEIARTALGENHPAFAASLSTLAWLYEDMGDHAAALPLKRLALEIHRAALGEHHPDYATSLNSLASLYAAMGDHAALPLSCQALEIRRIALGEHHPDYATSLNNLAELYQAMGDHAAALPLFHQALEIHRTALGEHHPHYAASLNNLAALYEDMGDHAAALPLYRLALEISRTALGEDHPDYATSLNNLALSYAAMGRASEALPLMEQAASINDRMIGQILAIGSERQRVAYLTTDLWKLYTFLSLVQQHLGDSLAAARAILDLVLRRKAITAGAVAAQRDAVLGGRYPALEPKLRELAALRMQIARKTLAGPGPEGLESHLRILAGWHARRERLEADLARQIPEMNLEHQLRAADRRAVALNLPEGVVLVEFVRFEVFDFQAVPARGESNWKPARYVAFVLPGGAPEEVHMIDLGEAEPIDRLIADFRAGIIAEAEADDGRDMARRREEAAPTAESDAGLALRATLFDRLAPALGSRTRLLIAPDGDLARLPFEVLPTGDGRRLIDAYQISYLSCGRDVLRFGAGVTGQTGDPLVVADPDFDLEAMISTGPVPAKPGFWSRLLGRGKKTIGSPTQSVPTPQTTAPSAGRHSRDLDRDRSAYHFHRLPGTRAEGERIATRLGVSPWLDATALEGRLKAACRSPRILHLATHGFFLPDQPRDLNCEGRGLGFDFGGFAGVNDGLTRLSGPMMENPMLRSGLALAGANTWLRSGNPPEEAEDGLLTAEDVTGLDLLATELVVLSACETGLGQVHVGEGVFGLRRAFVLAGAKTLVMSLWKVPDEPTRELMEDFYRRLLAGQGRAEALRQAQLAMKAKYPAPFYWGAFICQGDPSPLGTVRPGIAGTGVGT